MEEYLVYKHTSPSGKAYIGITKDYQRRCKQHRYESSTGSPYAFHNAIRKYGWDAFKHEIIIEGISKDEAGRLEQVFIRELGTMAPNGYNMTLGGEGVNTGTHSDESKLVQSKRTHSSLRKPVVPYLTPEGNWKVRKRVHNGVVMKTFTTYECALEYSEYLNELSWDELQGEPLLLALERIENVVGYAYHVASGGYIVRVKGKGKYAKSLDLALSLVRKLKKEQVLLLLGSI